MNRKKLYLVGGLLLFGASIILVWSFFFHNDKQVKGDLTRSSGIIQSPTSETFTDIKHQTLSYIYPHENTTKIDGVFIEFRLNGYRHALVIRRDSIAGIISVSDPNLHNSAENENVLQHSIELLNFLDQNIQILPFDRHQRNSPIFLLNGLIIHVHPNDGDISRLEITRENYQSPVFSELIPLIAGLISELNYQEISIEDLMKPKN